MRIDINLASQRYEDARQFYVRWVSALALVIVLTAVLAWLGWLSYKRTAGDRKLLNDFQARMNAFDDQRKQAEAILNRPENQDVRDQSRFWNDVIDQKSFSWTRLLSDLEKIMPARAYVTSVQPTVTPEKRLKLKLVIGSDKQDDANELVKKMEGSERFRGPQIVGEVIHSPAQGTPSGPGAGSQPLVEFTIETYYTPATPMQQQQHLVAKAGTP